VIFVWTLSPHLPRGLLAPWATIILSLFIVRSAWAVILLRFWRTRFAAGLVGYNNIVQYWLANLGVVMWGVLCIWTSTYAPELTHITFLIVVITALRHSQPSWGALQGHQSKEEWAAIKDPALRPKRTFRIYFVPVLTGILSWGIPLAYFCLIR